MSSINIKKLFYGLQSQMIAQLTTNKKYILHPTSKGDALETSWIDWLNQYLPKRYKVNKAFIIDSKGQLSQQIDLVIYDNQYSPFVFNQNGTLYIPAESVYAVFEIRPSINKKNLEYAARKIRSVRMLHRTSAKIYDFKGQHDGKLPGKIIGGIISNKSSWNPEFGTQFKNSFENLSKNKQINIGFAIESGSFLINYDDDPITFNISNKEESLIFFFLRLIEELQKLGTVPAIDILEYSKSLKSI
jgi:hypothetical protein